MLLLLSQFYHPPDLLPLHLKQHKDWSDMTHEWCKIGLTDSHV